MTDDEIIEVVRAHKEGKQIQWSHPSKRDWYTFEGQPEWNFAQFTYRIKPEPRKPREWEVAEFKDGTIWSTHSGTTGTDYRMIRVREVLE